MMGHDYRNTPALSKKVNVYYPEEQPVHRATLSSFRIGATVITQELYEEVTGKNPSIFKGKNLPVTNIGANFALKFCNALSASQGLEPCWDEKTGKCDFSKNGFRLPTEAEWEYACRAKTTTLYYSGNTERDLARIGWYIGNSNGTSHPVAEKEPNSWGLYDMHGNVLEFCYDGHPGHYTHVEYTSEDVVNPYTEFDFDFRVTRGGSWNSEACDCRSAFRSSFWTGGDDSFPGGNYYTGFRIVSPA